MQSPLIIAHGKIQGYPRDFHLKEERNTLEIRLILPGINKSALYIKIDGKQFLCKAFFTREFRSLFRRPEITITGTLPVYCEQHRITTEYRQGGCIITLAKDMDKLEIENA